MTLMKLDHIFERIIANDIAVEYEERLRIDAQFVLGQSERTSYERKRGKGTYCDRDAKTECLPYPFQEVPSREKA